MEIENVVLTSYLTGYKVTQEPRGVEEVETLSGRIYKYSTGVGLSLIHIYLDKIWAAIGKTLGEVASTAVKYLPTLVDTGMKMIDGVVTGISKNSASLAQSAAKAISTFADGAMDAFPKIVGVAGDLVIQFAGTIADELPTRIPKAVDV